MAKKLTRARPKAAPAQISEAEEMRQIKQAAAKRRAAPAKKKTGSAVAGAGNRGGKGASGRLAKPGSRTRQERDARVLPTKKNRGTGPAKAKGSINKDTRGSKTVTKKKKKKVPKRKPVTAPAPTVVPSENIVRTQRQGVPVTGTPFSSNITEQQRDILYSFLTMSGTELFQYTNSRSIDGMFDDVSIISVLSSRRKEYTPNTIIETLPPLIRNVWRVGDTMYVEVERATEGRRIVMQFFMGSKISKIGSVDYV